MADENRGSEGTFETFRKDLAECWSRLPDKALFFGLLLLWCVLFHFRGNAVFGWVETSSLFGWMYWAYETWPDDGHGMLIPFVVLVLFWLKRTELLSVPKRIWWPALGLMVLGLLMHLLGYTIQQTRLSIVGFFTGLYGLMGLVWGSFWLRASFFPMILFVFSVPMGGLTDPITFPLRLLVTKVSVGFASVVLGIPVVADGCRIIGEGGFRYDVVAECSGIRSLVSLLALTTIYGFITFRPAWKRVLMIVVAFPLAVVGNILRITGVIITGDAFGHNAGAYVEQKFGFITFALAVACVLVLGHLLRDHRAEREAAV